MEETKIETPIFKTYIEVAKNLFAEHPKFYSERAQDNILSFAKYLDSGRVLNAELQMLAMQQSRKIDGEVIQEMVKEFGLERCKEVVKRVYAKHHRVGKK